MSPARQHPAAGAGPRLAALAAAALCIGCGGPPPPPVADPGRETGPGFELPEPLPVSHEPAVTERVEIVTTRGRVVVGLFGEAAPTTVANFLSYVDAGFYDGTIFHRVLPAFMIQGGGFDADLERVPTEAPVGLEIIPGLEHTAGIVSMARISGEPHSATSQFFICVAEAPQLNGSYAAFGKVLEGYEVAMDISNEHTHSAQTDRGSMQDVPVAPIVIDSIRRVGTTR